MLVLKSMLMAALTAERMQPDGTVSVLKHQPRVLLQVVFSKLLLN